MPIPPVKFREGKFFNDGVVLSGLSLINSNPSFISPLMWPSSAINILEFFVARFSITAVAFVISASKKYPDWTSMTTVSPSTIIPALIPSAGGHKG